MNRATAMPMLKMALGALERAEPNPALAIGILREFLGASANVVAPTTEKPSGRAVTFAEAAAILGYSIKHVRTLAKAKRIPTIGAGRSCRVLVDEAIAALRTGAAPTTTNEDEVTSAGARWARRSALRLVEGGQ